MARKKAIVGSGAIDVTPDIVYLIEEIFCGGWCAWGVGLVRWRAVGVGALDGCDISSGKSCLSYV